MPNTLISVFVSNPATEPVEAPHPNTGVYVTGTQATAGGPWTVTHTLVSKTTTPLTMVGRLKNYPTVTVSVVASGGPNAGNIFNNVPLAPVGTSATGTSATTISVTASTSPNNLANRIFASATSTGTFLQIYQGTASAYPHTVASGATQYYKYQYVGSGFYDDSPLSSVFSGVASTVTTLIPVLANYAMNGGILRTASTGLNLHAGLSVLQVNLNGATSVDMSVGVNTGGGTTVFVSDNGVAKGLYGAGVNTLSGLSGGILTVTMAGQQRSYEQGEVKGADVTQFAFSAGGAGSFVVPAQTVRAIAIPGDSISNGALLSSPQTQAWTALLRKTGQSSTVMGYGSGTASVMMDPNYWLNPNPASGISLKAELHAILDGATEQAIITSIGTNDYGGANGGTAANGGLSPTDFQTRFNTFLTNVTTEFPAAKILILTPFYRTDEASTNSYTALLQAYRDAETATAAGRATVTVYDGRGILITSDLIDGVHPNLGGHLKILNFMQPALDSIFNGTSTTLVDMAGLAAANYTQPVNATVSGTTISKLSTSTNQFDGGAVATFLLGTTTGNGAKGQVKYTVPTAVRTGTTTGGTVFGVSTAAPNYSAVGSNGAPANYISIAAAFYFDGSQYGLIEAGQERPFITYPWPATGALPMLDILVTESQVKYYANRVLLYTSAYNPIPAFPLYVDVALSTPTTSALTGLQIAGANLVATPAPAAAPVAANATPVSWQNVNLTSSVNEAVTGAATIVNFAGTANTLSGFNGNGTVRFLITELSNDKLFGICKTRTTTDYAELPVCYYTNHAAPAVSKIFVLGTPIAASAATPAIGDTIDFVIENNVAGSTTTQCRVFKNAVEQPGSPVALPGPGLYFGTVALALNASIKAYYQTGSISVRP